MQVAESTLPKVMHEAMTGHVKWFNNQKGYGFIVSQDVPDIFVHHSAIQMEGYRTLQQGEPVRFDLVETAKGLQAVNVARDDR